MWGGGGSSSPPVTQKVNQEELDKQQSEKQAEQNTLAKKRKGIASTRLTDPVSDLTNQQNSAKRRVSLLGGGESAA